jgi:hypothetical protein
VFAVVPQCPRHVGRERKVARNTCAPTPKSR